MFGVLALIASLGLFDLASTGDAQQPGTLRRIGLVLVAFSPGSKEAQAFRPGLVDAGYAEERDLVVQSQADVIVADTTIATQSLKRATSTIPIVMAMVSDPVGSGLVANLARQPISNDLCPYSSSATEPAAFQGG